MLVLALLGKMQLIHFDEAPMLAQFMCHIRELQKTKGFSQKKCYSSSTFAAMFYSADTQHTAMTIHVGAHPW